MNIVKSQDIEIAQPFVEGGEAVLSSLYDLQSPQQFRDDFSACVQRLATKEEVRLEVMQFELTKDTEPIFAALQEAKANGVAARFHYDRIALRHIRAEDQETGELHQAYSYLGRNLVRFGDRKMLDEAARNRLELLDNFEQNGITDSEYKQRGAHRHRSHNHIKLAVAGDAAWFGTMNLRGIDFNLSNFMLKTTDPGTVNFLKTVFDQSEQPQAGDDQEHVVDENSRLLVDGGRKGESIIYDTASRMMDSLDAGDEFVMISQWPPVRMMYGRLADQWTKKMQAGVRGEFLLPPAEDLHFNKRASQKLQTWVRAKEAETEGMTATNLPEATHAKALLVTRANGEKEVLFGSHNLTRWTVKNGTRELAMWSKDPLVVAQIEQFLDSVRA